MDAPPGTRDGYVEAAVGAVPNAYIALAAGRLSQIAGWLGETRDEEFYGNVSATILVNMREQLYDASTGAFVDGLGGKAAAHSSVQSPNLESVLRLIVNRLMRCF